MNEQTTLNLTHMVRTAQAHDKGHTPDSKVPGLLLLHGRGADEADLMGLESALDPRLTIVSPRAPFRLGPGYAWYDMFQVGSPDPETMAVSMGEIEEFIGGMLETYNIDPKRLYLLGFSQGAILSAAIALTTPERVTAVVMHSGYVPLSAGLDLHPEAIAGKPFFLAHGKYDDVIPVTYGRDADEYLTEAGARITYQEYPIGHSISEESLYDLSEWLTAEIDNTSSEV